MWEAKVLADATELGLFEKVSSDPAGAITRADAMQMTYNALYVNAVANGTAIDTLVGKTYENKTLNSVGNDVAQELNLSYSSEVADADVFGRPATTIKDVKKNEVTTYQAEPVLTYTTGVTGGDIWTALGKPTADVEGTKYVDGVGTTLSGIEKNSKAPFGGNGILTEVYTQSLRSVRFAVFWSIPRFQFGSRARISRKNFSASSSGREKGMP